MATVPDEIGQAWQYLQAGHVAHAEHCCRQLLNVNRSHPQVWYVLGLACQLQGKADDAAASYEQALRLRPDYVEVNNNLAVLYVNQGRCAKPKPAAVRP